MRSTATLEHRVRATIASRAPSLARSPRIVLACSGGPDSTAMAALLCKVGVAAPGRDVVARFDHRLRGAAASVDERNAATTLARRYGLAYHEGAWDAPRPSEAAAREARYAFLCDVAGRYDATAVVTGHTRDDQLETLLMHILRGCGLRGLVGMNVEDAFPLRRDTISEGLSKRANRPLRVVRPLLTLTRAETRGFCEARRLGYVDDANNADLRFLRNRVRHVLLPSLQRVTPGADDMLLRVSDEARIQLRMCDIAAAGAAIGCDTSGVSVTLARGALRSMPPVVRAHAFRLALERLPGGARDFGRVHYATMAAAVERRTGATYQLPRGVQLHVDANELVLSAGAPPVQAISSDVALPLPYAGVVGVWRIEATPAPSPGAAWGACATVGASAGAVLRARRPGDRMRLAAGTKKLQDVYVDRKVPRRERDAAPVIATDGIVWWTPFAAAQAPSGGDVRWYAVRASHV